MPTFTLCRVDICTYVCIVDTPVFFHADDWNSNISSAFLTKTDKSVFISDYGWTYFVLKCFICMWPVGKGLYRPPPFGNPVGCDF